MPDTVAIRPPEGMHGQALLKDPVFNKGTAFTLKERRKYGLEGLLPPAVDTLDRQVERVLGHLSPVIGYDKASAIAHEAHDRDLSLKEAALQSGYIDERRFGQIVDPSKMIGRGVAGA